MKKYWGIALIALLTGSCNTDFNTTIKGSYKEGAGEYLKFEMLNIAQVQFIDSVKVQKNGSFNFNFNLNSPELILVKNERNKNINLLVFPEDNIELTIPEKSFSNAYAVKGSDESENIRMLVENVNRTKFQLDSISKALDLIEDLEGPEAKVLISSYQQIFQKQKRNNIRFVVENLNSLASVYALYQRITEDIYIFNDAKDLQYFKIVADSIKVKFPGSTLTASLVNDVNRRVSEYNTMATLNTLSKTNVIETGLIDLNIDDTNGNKISLSSFKGKVILLNFWASWNGQSRDTNRSLKKIYDQYHKRGFEVYSVALDKDRNSWRSVIDFEEYEWINVSELSYPYSYAATIYNVTALPTNFLIDREGNIVAKNLTGSVLATWLDNLL